MTDPPRGHCLKPVARVRFAGLTCCTSSIHSLPSHHHDHPFAWPINPPSCSLPPLSVCVTFATSLPAGSDPLHTLTLRRILEPFSATLHIALRCMGHRTSCRLLPTAALEAVPTRTHTFHQRIHPLVAIMRVNCRSANCVVRSGMRPDPWDCAPLTRVVGDDRFSVTSSPAPASERTLRSSASGAFKCRTTGDDKSRDAILALPTTRWLKRLRTNTQQCGKLRTRAEANAAACRRQRTAGATTACGQAACARTAPGLAGRREPHFA